MISFGVLLVHDVGAILRHPFWLDEAWVALQTRAPLREVPDLTASTPLGFALLLRPFAAMGDQAPRLVPLAFSAATVVLAAVFAGRLPWPTATARVCATVSAGVAVLIAPSSLVRNDLKQYTADAFMTVLVFLLCSRVDERWALPRLAALSACAGLGALLSVAGSFAGFACLGAILVLRVFRRDWRAAAWVAVATAASALVAGTVYWTTLADTRRAAYRQFWRRFFLDGDVGDILAGVWRLFAAQHDAIGVGPPLVVIALMIAGSVTLWVLGRPSVALGFLALWLELAILGALERYPFLDLRTSHFLFVLSAAVAAIGFGGVVALVSVRWARSPIWVCAAVVVLWLPYVGAHRGLIRDVALPDEDVRSQTAYVMAHRTPDDVVLVNAAGSYGFAYYLDESPAGFEPAPAVGPGYLPRFPDSTRVIVAAGRSTEAIEESLRRAVASARSRNARVWLVRSHTVASERQALEQAAADLGVTITPVCVTSVSTPSASAECADSEQLAYLDLGGRGA